jgi:hypothetical protein
MSRNVRGHCPKVIDIMLSSSYCKSILLEAGSWRPRRLGHLRASEQAGFKSGWIAGGRGMARMNAASQPGNSIIWHTVC